MKHQIKNEIDYLLAQAQIERDIAQEIVESIRKKWQEAEKKSGLKANDEKSDIYYEEKLALKMLEFYKEEEKIITLYVEAKKNYPLLAELMENKKPYLKDMLEEAKVLYEKLGNNI